MQSSVATWLRSVQGGLATDRPAAMGEASAHLAIAGVPELALDPRMSAPPSSSQVANVCRVE